MKKPIAYVTDHAVLRYLERVLQVDIEAHRQEIGRMVDRALEHEGCSGVVIDGFSYKLRGNAVTTVVEANRCCDLFAREPWPGHDVWGKETEKFGGENG